jgi:ADP-heptose:LPS heptosyltransferase
VDGDIRRIAIFRALMLGDLLCAVPALRALRGAYPDAEITLIGLPWAKSFVSRFSEYLDDFLEFPGFPGFPEREPDIAGFPKFLTNAHLRNFDLAIQLHGSGGLANPITSLLGAHRTAGFFVPGEWCPDERMYLAYPEHETEIWRFLRLMEFLGIPLDGDDLEFPVGELDLRDFRAIDESGQLFGREYVCIHPGARFQSRRWTPEKFADVADRLAAEGLRIVLTGTNAERELASAVSDAMRSPSIDLAGKTSLGALGVLFKHARLLISNDTGVSHVAAATRTPSVVIVLGSDPARWQMYDPSRHHVVYEDIKCRPCEFVECPIGHLCSKAVSPDRVFAEAMRLLEPVAANPAYAN